MGQVSCIVVALLIIANQLAHVLTYQQYLLNLEYYATVLCENKSMPVLACHGKCQLKEALNKNQENQKKIPGGIEHLPVECLAERQPACFVFRNVFATLINQSGTLLLDGYNDQLDPPPQGKNQALFAC